MKKFVFLALATLLCGGCALTPPHKTLSGHVNSVYGDGFHALQFPVQDKFIGAEWIVSQSRPNDTKGPGIQNLKEDRTANLFASNSNEFFLAVQSLYNLGPGADVRARFDQTFLNNGVTLIRAANPGEIPFADQDTWYVTEAVAANGFVSNAAAGAGARVFITQPGGKLADLGTGASMDKKSGMSGDKLIVAYKVEKIKKTSYASVVEPALSEPPKTLTLDQTRQSFRSTDLDAKLMYYSNRNEFEKFSQELVWACDEAGFQNGNGTIKSIWVVRLKDENPERLIAFPALWNQGVEIKDCDRFSGIIKSSIHSNTGKIERVRATIKRLDDKFEPETNRPLGANFDIKITKESFELETLK